MYLIKVQIGLEGTPPAAPISAQHVDYSPLSLKAPHGFPTLAQHHRNSYISLHCSPTCCKTSRKKKATSPQIFNRRSDERYYICTAYNFEKYPSSFLLDILHPFLGLLPVSAAPSYTAANLYRSDEYSGTWNGRHSWRCPSSASHQRTGQRDSQVRTATTQQ